MVYDYNTWSNKNNMLTEATANNIKFIPKGEEWRYTGNSNPLFAGNFEFSDSRNTYIIFDLDPADQSWVDSKSPVIKNDEKVFRYETETTKIGNLQPLVKINLGNGYVYFNEADGDTEDILFGKKGKKAKFINLKTL